MGVLIKLRLEKTNATIGYVSELPGMHGLELEREYGLIPISPKENLYVVRVASYDRPDERKKQSPEIVQHYGDIKISTNE